MKIDQEMKGGAKTKSSGSWYAKQAKLLDIDLDDELLAEVEGDDDNTRQRDEKLNNLKIQLKALIDKPIIPKGVSPLYLTRKKFETLGMINEVKHNAIEDFLKNPTPKTKKRNTPEKPEKLHGKIETSITPPKRGLNTPENPKKLNRKIETTVTPRRPLGKPTVKSQKRPFGKPSVKPSKRSFGKPTTKFQKRRK